jgi:penicillin-binding protein 1A
MSGDSYGMKPRVRSFLKFLGWSLAATALLVGAAVVALVVLHSRYTERAAKFDLTKIDDVAERSSVYDSNGEFYSYFGGENRLVVPLTKVSKHFLNALLAREDNRFWEHHGVDAKGVVRAFLANVRAGETKQGASTLTQQLARNACGLQERSLDRKALEAVLAQRIEAQYTKDQILELYINRIYFGAGFYGIETAARGYFGKAAMDLTLGESATLAALIRNPKRLSPTRDLGAALEQRDIVLASMAELKFISADELAAAKAQQLMLTKRSAVRVTDDSVMDAVLQELSTILAPETMEYGGLKVSMTIDPQLQGLAQAAADRRLSEVEAQKGFPHPKKRDFVPGMDGEKEKPTDYLQASVVIVDNRSGALRAVVGGRDYAQSKYSRALLSKRQIGSTFKPFVYAAAFERGLLPGTAIDDSKIAAGEFKGLPKTWSPENSDGEYGGLQPASLGLLKSRNTMSVRVGEFASLPKVREVAQRAGINDTIPNLPVVYLGAFETTVRDVTAAYMIFPNLGVYRKTYLISSVEDRDGRVLWEAPQTETKVVAPETAWMVSSILQQVMKTGTAAKSSSLGWKKNGAGKTGTTNDYFDAWFVGYTTSLTCGVWVGLDQPQTIMEKGYGSTLALPIWVDIMQQLPEKTYPSAPFDAAMPMTKVALCSLSGARATSTCIAQRCGYNVQIPTSRLPKESCQTHPEPAPLPIAVIPPPTAPVTTLTSPTSMEPQITQPVTNVQPDRVAKSVAPVATASNGMRQQTLTAPAPSPMSVQQVVQPGRRQDAIPREPLIGEVPTSPVPAPIPRAVPVTRRAAAAPQSGAGMPPGLPNTATATAPAVTVRPLLPEGVSEQRIVEKMADGRTRIRIIRTTRTPNNTDR